MNRLYFYIFRDNIFDVLEGKLINSNRYYLENGKTRIKKEKQTLDVVYGKACEVIMYSKSNDNLEAFFNGAISFINKQLSKYKRTYDNYLMKDMNEKIELLSKKIKKYHDLLKCIMAYQENNNIG